MRVPLEVVQGQVAAFNARDAEAFTACYSSDATLVGPDGNVMMQGHDAITGMYAQLFAQSPDLHVDVLSRMTVGNWVVDEEKCSGFVFDGFPSDLHTVVVYQVGDGVIVRSQVLM
jgi:uncharacterized protein (TIGR02246 family)